MKRMSRRILKRIRRDVCICKKGLVVLFSARVVFTQGAKSPLLYMARSIRLGGRIRKQPEIAEKTF